MNLPRVFDSNFNFVRRLHPISCSISESIEPINQARLVVPVSEIVPIRGWVEIFKPNGSAGYYRVSAQETDVFNKAVTLTLDHCICTLMDSIIPEGNTDGEELYYDGTVSTVLTRILSKQQTQMWQTGNVNVESADDDVSVNIEWNNVLDAVNSLMEQLPEYYISFRFTTRPWYIDIKPLPTSVTAEGRVSRNVLSASVSYDDSELYTRVYCDGMENTISGQTVNYVEADTVSTYGIISYKLDVNDDFSNGKKKRFCNRYLKKHKNPAISVQIDALDLASVTGVSVDSFSIGEKFRLALPDYGVAVEQCIVGIDYSDTYGQPLAVRLSLANNMKTFIDNVTKAKKENKDAARRGGGRAKKAQADVDEVTSEYNHYKEESDEKFSLIYSETEWAEKEAEKQREGTNYVSSFTQTAREIALRVKAGEIASGINLTAQSAKIYASKIELSGYVTATEFSALKGSFENLTSGTTTTYTLSVTAVVAGNITPNNIAGHPLNHYTVTDTGGTNRTVWGW